MCGSSETCAYTVLGVSHSASGADIKTAFRKLSLINHPDKLGNRSDREKLAGEEKMKAINNAYDILGDPEARARYDATSSRPRPAAKRPAKSSPRAPKRPPKRKRDPSASSDEDPRANPPPKKARKTNAKSSKRHPEIYEHDNNGWGLSATISSKHCVLGDVQDITTSKMHHVCISLAFSLKVNDGCAASKDGTKDYDIRLNISKTPGGRDISSITTLLKEGYLQRPRKRCERTLIVTIVSLRTTGPLEKPLQAFFDFQAPVPPPPQARACATNLVFSRTEPAQQVLDFEPSPLSPTFPRACPESNITTLPELKLRDIPIRWVDLKTPGEKYKIEEWNGEKWHRMAAVGFRTILSQFDRK